MSNRVCIWIEYIIKSLNIRMCLRSARQLAPLIMCTVFLIDKKRDADVDLKPAYHLCPLNSAFNLFLIAFCLCFQTEWTRILLLHGPSRGMCGSACLPVGQHMEASAPNGIFCHGGAVWFISLLSPGDPRHLPARNDRGH